MEGMQFYGFHGVNVEERSLGQSYVVDLAVERLDGTAGGPRRGAGAMGIGPDTCAGDCCPDLRQRDHPSGDPRMPVS